MSAKQRNEAAHQSKHKHTRKPSRLPLILAVGGIAVLVIALLTLKDQSQTTMSSAVSSTAADPSAILEEQLNTALAENHPTLGFYHSNNCKNCIIMTEMIAEVYPDYADAVTLVDVDVYDERNRSLLQRERIQYIPTMIFYDRNGGTEIIVGPMKEEDLRQMLAALVGGG